LQVISYEHTTLPAANYNFRLRRDLLVTAPAANLQQNLSLKLLGTPDHRAQPQRVTRCTNRHHVSAREVRPVERHQRGIMNYELGDFTIAIAQPFISRAAAIGRNVSG
jgi:hypothetical protein